MEQLSEAVLAKLQEGVKAAIARRARKTLDAGAPLREWACVQTKPQEESKACLWIRNDEHECYCPMARDPYRPQFVRPLFNRYIFVVIDERWRDVLLLPGVHQMLMTGEHPSVLRIVYRQGRKRRLHVISGSEVISHIKSQEGRDGVILLPRQTPLLRGEPFERGQVLHVKDRWHALSGRDLLFAGMKGRDRVQVMLSWFGTERVIDIDLRLVSAG